MTDTRSWPLYVLNLCYIVIPSLIILAHNLVLIWHKHLLPRCHLSSLFPWGTRIVVSSFKGSSYLHLLNCTLAFVLFIYEDKWLGKDDTSCLEDKWFRYFDTLCEIRTSSSIYRVCVKIYFAIKTVCFVRDGPILACFHK